jgi:hypothetical protein
MNYSENNNPDSFASPVIVSRTFYIGTAPPSKSAVSAPPPPITFASPEKSFSAPTLVPQGPTNYPFVPVSPLRHTPYVLVHPYKPDIPNLRNATTQKSVELEIPRDACSSSQTLTTLLGKPSGEIYKKVLQAIGEDPAYDKTTQIHYWTNSGRGAIIIDPRYDTIMKGAIRNFMYYMNPHGWNLIVMSCSAHKKKIQKDFPNCQFIAFDDSIVTKNAETNEYNISIADYNRLLKNVDFWKKMPEKVVVFQKDCFMYKMFPDYFAEHYDYAGANFYNHPSPMYGGINGGFSLRKRNTMIECIEQVRLTNEHISELDKRMNEDVFFTHACEHLHKLVPDKIARTFLAIEIDMNTETCAYHGWHHNYHSSEFAVYMLCKSAFAYPYLRKIAPTI